MYDYKDLDKRKIILLNTFLTANRLQAAMDTTVWGEITAKQWLVINMLDMFEAPPALMQLAQMCGTSHQNIKQIVMKLEEKGFVNAAHDGADKRIMRVAVTDKCRQWLAANEHLSEDFSDQLFSNLSDDEVQTMAISGGKFYYALEQMWETTHKNNVAVSSTAAKE